MFTYNSWSEKYDYMMKAAVRSAIQVGGVMPYCMFAGDEASAVYRFLLESGVQVSVPVARS